MKQDISVFTPFKDDWQYDSWSHETYATTCLHGTEQVCGSNHDPTQQSSALLWIKIKCSMFSVFCKNIQTSEGHMLI